MQYAATIMDSHISIPLESILKHPYRARHYLFISQSPSSRDSNNNNNNSSGSSGRSDSSLVDCIKTPAGHRDTVLAYLNKAIRALKGMKVGSSGALKMEDIVPWEMVTDENFTAALKKDSEEAEDDWEVERHLKVDRANSLTRKKREVVRRRMRRMRNSGFDVASSFPIAEGQGTRQGQPIEREGEGGMGWSILGIAMVGEIALGSLASQTCDSLSISFPSSLSSTSSPSSSIFSFAASSSSLSSPSSSQRAASTLMTGIRPMISRVYSAEHLWGTFYPMLFLLLRSPQLSAGEGLRLISQLGEVSKDSCLTIRQSVSQSVSQSVNQSVNEVNLAQPTSYAPT